METAPFLYSDAFGIIFVYENKKISVIIVFRKINCIFANEIL